MAVPALEIKPDEAQLAALQAAFADAPAKVDKVIYRAINRAVGTMRSRMIKAAAKLLGIKQKIVKGRVWVQKATRKKLFAQVRGGAYGFPYMLFAPVQTETGVRVKVKKKFVIEHAFIATMPSGHVGVFRRRQPVKGPRLPILEERTDSITEVIREVGAQPDIVAAGRETLNKRIAQEMNLILEGKRK